MCIFLESIVCVQTTDAENFYNKMQTFTDSHKTRQFGVQTEDLVFKEVVVLAAHRFKFKKQAACFGCLR